MAVWRTLILLLTILIGLESAFATTIVVLKTQSEIVAGADSMARSIGEDGRTFSSCKIFPVHDFFIASAGLYQLDDSARLNIQRVVMRAAQKSAALGQAVNDSEWQIASALSRAAYDAQGNEELQKELLRGNVLTFFFGFENGKPAVYWRRFYIAEQKTKSPVLIEGDDCGPDCVPRIGFIISHTPSREIADFLVHNQNSLSNEKPIRIVRDLMALDIEANKHRSGPPVDILRIDANGPTWIDKKPGCP
jgi:hypothetical protein